MRLPSGLSHQVNSLRALANRARDRSDGDANKSLPERLVDVFVHTWDLGFTAFGGPPVHFQILHQRFVAKHKWVDEQTVRATSLIFATLLGFPKSKGAIEQHDLKTTIFGMNYEQARLTLIQYQELFALAQALPGPASTKMLFALSLHHAGFLPALLAFALWCLPGTLGMFALALGVTRMSDTLPAPVYPLLSGLNASTVGIIALAAVQLAEKAIRDRLTRILVIFGACAGLCYSALWYFPVLIAIGGVSTVVWDGWLGREVGALKRRVKRRREGRGRAEEQGMGVVESVEVGSSGARTEGGSVQKRSAVNGSGAVAAASEQRDVVAASGAGEAQVVVNAVAAPAYSIRIRVGIAIVILFFGTCLHSLLQMTINVPDPSPASFLAFLLARGLLTTPPLALDLFANMYLAGTIIFGGGPVVIPLLRSYVVDPGWVSPRDFLLGLAIIQAFPGPNFNFAVYLGTLAIQRSRFPSVFGAFLGFVGIFTPGLTLSIAAQSFWRVMRRKKWVGDLLRGVNATAVGLVFTAVYRLWEIGYLTAEVGRGQSLAAEPWWVVVAAVTYAESAWFGVPPAVAIVLGAVLGLCWYGAVGR